MESHFGSLSFRRSKLSIYEGQTLETPSREPTWDTVLAREQKKVAPIRGGGDGKGWVGSEGRLTEGLELGPDCMGR